MEISRFRGSIERFPKIFLYNIQGGIFRVLNTKKSFNCTILQGSAANFRFNYFGDLKLAKTQKISFLALEAEGDFVDQI